MIEISKNAETEIQLTVFHHIVKRLSLYSKRSHAKPSAEVTYMCLLQAFSFVVSFLKRFTQFTIHCCFCQFVLHFFELFSHFKSK